jgi:hypothetical protein
VGALGTNPASIGWPYLPAFPNDIAAMTEIFSVDDEKLDPNRFLTPRDCGGLVRIVEGVVGQQAAVVV